MDDAFGRRAAAARESDVPRRSPARTPSFALEPCRPRADNSSMRDALPGCNGPAVQEQAQSTVRSAPRVLRSTAWLWLPVVAALALRLAFVAATPGYTPLRNDDSIYD